MVAEAAEVAKSAKVQRGIRERIRGIKTTIGQRSISGSAFIPSGGGIPPRTA
jgi:hypothetical protein